MSVTYGVCKEMLKKNGGRRNDLKQGDENLSEHANEARMILAVNFDSHLTIVRSEWEACTTLRDSSGSVGGANPSRKHTGQKSSGHGDGRGG